MAPHQDTSSFYQGVHWVHGKVTGPFCWMSSRGPSPGAEAQLYKVTTRHPPAVLVMTGVSPGEAETTTPELELTGCCRAKPHPHPGGTQQ